MVVFKDTSMISFIHEKKREFKEEEEEVLKKTQQRMMTIVEGERRDDDDDDDDDDDSFLLWEVIVKCDDICFTLVLPRLNRTDLKFLYEVNTETRKLIKRSSREKELKGRFKVEEMSSISTLEVAWENKSLWSGDLCDERSSFCNKVARTNKLELLECVRDRINIIKRERIIQKRRRRRRQQLKKLSFSKK